MSFLADPVYDGQNVSPGDTFTVCRMIHVGGAGTLIVTLASGNQVTLNVVAGQLLPIRATSIDVASTATDIVVFR